MPTPDRTSLDEIVSAGRELLESEGLTGLTMQAVATRVGVRAPSLYKRVRNRAELVSRVAEATARELGDRLDAAAVAAPDAPARLMVLARTFRGFAHERPAAFGLLFAPGSDLAIDADVLAGSSASMLAVAAELSGPRSRARLGTHAHGVGVRVRQHGALRSVPPRRRRRARLRVRRASTRRGPCRATCVTAASPTCGFS